VSELELEDHEGPPRVERGAVEAAAADLSAWIVQLRGPKEEQLKSPWNTLEVAKLFVGMLIAVGAALSGFTVTRYFRELDELKARREAIQQLSHAILERRIRSAMLFEALKRHSDNTIAASYAEVDRRKKEYDESFVSWNANVRGYMLTLRQAASGAGISMPAYSGASSKITNSASAANAEHTVIQSGYTVFESYFQRSLSLYTFKKIDKCLTTGYDEFIRHSNPMPALEACQIETRLRQALVCGYALTEQLHLLTGQVLTSSEAETEIKKKCRIDKPIVAEAEDEEEPE
jgi:hypothetical protein